ncbi:sugar transferase [Cecembia rubra]|uniref:Putative colanic acid biosynthesis UDP-glucose lipid carrier transferase n=1 Tax=Cecembia rubra TaxID=1485585 RepID=A0A2P8DVH7_9BACT|nr:sugar transferase [Cecembia rubra]PSL01222.1 putative colanic acid biosynthesis UDP-glucose lipid carrier transferase [Cecembia rubra]
METLLSNPSNVIEKEVGSGIVFKKYSDNLLNSPEVLLKRVMDIILSSIFLLFVGIWLFPLIGLLIKIDSKGPVFYRQLRDGQYNNKFLCLKFRTMTFDPTANFEQARKGDPRITKIGAFLRRTSIDELPQLVNVLIGDMSIVGPRPHAVEMNQDFERRYRNYNFRHLVKPGITGLAQAKGFRGEIKVDYDMKSRLKLDLFYIEKWSVGFDVMIIFFTLRDIIFKSENAY